MLKSEALKEEYESANAANEALQAANQALRTRLTRSPEEVSPGSRGRFGMCMARCAAPEFDDDLWEDEEDHGRTPAQPSIASLHGRRAHLAACVGRRP